MSELLKIIVPESVVYAGFPAIVFASVDFPEPLWPDNSTRSPVFIFMFISYSNFSFDSDKPGFLSAKVFLCQTFFAYGQI